MHIVVNLKDNIDAISMHVHFICKLDIFYVL